MIVRLTKIDKPLLQHSTFCYIALQQQAAKVVQFALFMRNMLHYFHSFLNCFFAFQGVAGAKYTGPCRCQNCPFVELLYNGYIKKSISQRPVMHGQIDRTLSIPIYKRKCPVSCGIRPPSFHCGGTAAGKWYGSAGHSTASASTGP